MRRLGGVRRHLVGCRARTHVTKARAKGNGTEGIFYGGAKAPTSRSKADARASCKRFSKACAEGAQKEI